MKYKLGILGGMGPLATTKLYEKIVNATVSSCDQEHLEMVILNKCTIPDRTKAIFEGGESPVTKLNEGIDELIKCGCEYFIIPCNTAHYFKNQFNLQNKIKFIDMIESTINYLLLNHKDKKICVLCTDGTRKVDLYKHDQLNISYPNSVIQKQVMEVIYNTKAGLDMFDLLNEITKNKEYDIYLLACTELSIYKNQLGDNTIDAMDVLVRETLTKCGKRCK